MRFEVTDAIKGTASKANGLPSKSELRRCSGFSETGRTCSRPSSSTTTHAEEDEPDEEIEDGDEDDDIGEEIN